MKQDKPDDLRAFAAEVLAILDAEREALAIMPNPSPIARFGSIVSLLVRAARRHGFDAHIEPKLSALCAAVSRSGDEAERRLLDGGEREREA